jgi:biotin carboxylase
MSDPSRASTSGEYSVADPHALIICPASSGHLYPAEARRMGMRVTVITTNRDDLYLPEHVRACADDIIEIDRIDTDDDVIKVAEMVHRRNPITAVLAGNEFMVEAASTIASTFGLPGLPPSSVAAVRDKAVMRARLHEAGVRAPRFAAASTSADAVAAARAIGFPCVIKPAAMAGTVGVTRVDTPEELRQAYRMIPTEDQLSLFGRMPDTKVVIESYITGPEFSVEGYVDGRGGVEVLAITEKRLGPEPKFQQRAHFVRPAATVSGHESICAYIKDVVQALGISLGTFHAELRLAPEGPTLIEIGVRLAGDHITDMVETVTGVSMAGMSIALSSGMPLPEARPAPAAVAGIHYVSEPKLIGRTYLELAGWEEAIGLPGVVEAVVSIAPGEMIPDESDFRSRVAYIKFQTTDFPTAVALRDKLDGMISVRY